MADLRYRYTLVRDLRDPLTRRGLPERSLLFVMVNPSTADGEDGGADDPTIRKCIGFAKRAGYDGLFVGNVAPLRATYPYDLVRAIYAGDDVFRAAENDEAIGTMCRGAKCVVLA